MSRNEKGDYRIVLDEKHINLFEKYAEDMYALTPEAKPFRYIKEYDDLKSLKDIIAQRFFDVYKHICETHSNTNLNFELRIKSQMSYFEKSYLKTQEEIKKGTYNPKSPPLIYDGIGLRIVINSHEFKIAQSGSFLSEKTQKQYYAIRTPDNTLLKLCIGDVVDVGNGQTIVVTADNLICNSDGSLSIRNENGDSFSLKNRTLEKTDSKTLEAFCYDVGKTLSEHLIKLGFVSIEKRNKDFIKNPKRTYKFKNWNSMEAFSKSYNTHSKKVKSKIRYLKENSNKINYQRDKRFATASYQTLHLGFYDPEYKYRMEVQIRDQHMHNIAEKDPHIGHDTYKELVFDATSKYRIPDTCVYKKFKNGFDYTFYDEEYMYQKIFKMSKEEVFKKIAEMYEGEEPEH